MPYVTFSSRSETTISFIIRNLSQQTTWYSSFSYRIDGGPWRIVSPGGTNFTDGLNSGKWTSPIITASGLSCGRTYSIETRASRNTTNYPTGLLPEYTSACPLPPPNTASVTATALSKTSMSVAWNSVSTATGFYIDRSTNGATWTHIRTETSTSWLDSGLSEYTIYYYRVRSYNSAGSSVGTASIGTRTLDETPPSVWNVRGDAMSQEIKITWNASDAQSGLQYFRVYRNSYFVTINNGGTREYTFTNLTENTTYSFYVQAFDNAGNSSTSSTIQLTTLTGRPNNWLWVTPKMAGINFNITATEWNDFTRRINEFRRYKGLPTIEFPVAYRGNNFTATIFNQVRAAIGGMNATGIADKTAGMEIHARDFEILRAKLNEL